VVRYVCPLCRGSYQGSFQAWLLQSARGALRCDNPACWGRYVEEPFPIILREPGRVVDRLLEVPEPIGLSAWAMQLQTLPSDSLLLEVLRRRSTWLWAHYHDLFPERYTPDWIEPTPFALRALSLLDELSLTPTTSVLVAGANAGREALEVGRRLLGRVPEGEAAPSVPPVIAADLDPAMLRVLVQLQREGQATALLRAGEDSWHALETIELPPALRAGGALVQALCCDLLDPPFEAGSFDVIVALRGSGGASPSRRRHTKREPKTIFIYKNCLWLPFCVPPAARGEPPLDPTLGYDALVVAVGSDPDFHGMAGLREVALPYRTAHDAVRIKSRVVARFVARCVAARLRGWSVR
jgi:SAM-dependent methyltransferase